MVDFVYPSIFGIGASILFTVLMIACCVRWLRLQKLRRTSPTGYPTGPTCISNSRTRSTFPVTSGPLNYPPPYSNRQRPTRASSSTGTSRQPISPMYLNPYCLYNGPNENRAAAQRTANEGTNVNLGSDPTNGPVPIHGNDSFNFTSSNSTVSSQAPPSYYEGPPSYDDVLAAGKAITVSKVNKEQN